MSSSSSPIEIFDPSRRIHSSRTLLCIALSCQKVYSLAFKSTMRLPMAFEKKYYFFNFFPPLFLPLLSLLIFNLIKVHNYFFNSLQSLFLLLCILIGILFYCTEPQIEMILWKNQNGFRRNTSTTSQIMTIRQILEGVLAKKT